MQRINITYIKKNILVIQYIKGILKLIFALTLQNIFEYTLLLFCVLIKLKGKAAHLLIQVNCMTYHGP